MILTKSMSYAYLSEAGFAVCGDIVISPDAHACTLGALGALSINAYASKNDTFTVTVPASVKIELIGRCRPWVSGKDIALTLSAMLGKGEECGCVLEFSGIGMKLLSMNERFTIANNMAELGAASVLFEIDDTTLSYIKERSQKPYKIYSSDSDAIYKKTFKLNLSEIMPMVMTSDLIIPAAEIRESKISSVVIGFCSNGRIDDMRSAANVVKNKKISENICAYIVPATDKVLCAMSEEGIDKIFSNSGFTVCSPLNETDFEKSINLNGTCLSTSGILFKNNKNITMYTASPATCAASAIAGKTSTASDVI